MSEQENRLAVLKSPILAKTVVRRGDGYEVIVVHEGATQKEFYRVYGCQARRSPRKAWKFTRDFERDLSPQYHHDYQTFLAHYCQSQGAEILFSRVYKPRILSFLTQKTALTPSVNPNISMKTMWDMKDKANGLYKAQPRKGFYANLRDRNMDTLPTQSEDEVHVYLDDCPTCGNRHQVAHWPGGKITCTDYIETKKNPALRYKGMRDKAFVFGIGRW